MARGRKSSAKSSTKSSSNFRRANKAGCITKLSGNRRNPYTVVITTGREWIPETFKWKQTRKRIGYYPTKEDAERALYEYLLNPYDLDSRKVTFGELFELVKKNKFENLANRTKVTYNAAAKYLEPILDRAIFELKAGELQNTIDLCTFGSGTKKNIRTLINMVFNYAMENDIVSKNYADYIKIEESEATFERIPFTNNEISWLWSTSDDYKSQVLLILLYSGMRVNELLKLPRENCNIEEWYFDIPKKLAKNTSSIRKVPIHKEIQNIVLTFYNRGKSDLMVKENGTTIMYNNFVARDMKKLNEHFETEHRFHDTRHTFITKAHEVRMDDLCLKRIVGHVASDITSRVYTHITMKELSQEISKISYK